MNYTIFIDRLLTFNVVELATLFVAAIGLWYAGNQLRSAKNTALADFLVRLDERFSSETFKQIANEIESGQFSIDDNRLADVYNYLGAFEILKLLMDRKLLDIYTIRYMFGYYIIAAYQNVEMRQRINFDGVYWREFKVPAEKMIAYQQKELKRFKKLTDGGKLRLDDKSA